jgi:predicted DNA-binding ArsR family transcriptional regulator
MDDAIITAIEEKRRLKILYNVGGARIIEPHYYGKDEYGQKKLRAYQVSGYSEGGETRGWKLLIVSKIKYIELLDEQFEKPRPGYNPGTDYHIPYTICKI